MANYTAIEYLSMKTPLAYQISEYDCAQVTLLNALRYLYARGEISPTIVKDITQYTLDTYNSKGELGKCGTSPYVMEYLGNWINNNISGLCVDLKAEVLKEDEASIYSDKLEVCMKNGGVAILRVWSECEHYVLCTKMDEKNAYIFDPYYVPEDDYDDDPECKIVTDKPFEYNRVVSKVRINSKSKRDFAIVRNENKMILLLYRKK